MSESHGGRSWGRALAWSLWLLLLAGWTAALLNPSAPGAGEAVMGETLQFWAGKSLHVGAYAFLAFTNWWLAPSWRLRWAVWAALLAHAALTEFGQTFVEGRSGSFMDVGINASGLTLGLLAGKALWRRPSSPSPHPSFPLHAAHPDDAAPSRPSA